jgi:histidyl-tRNA synthetase
VVGVAEADHADAVSLAASLRDLDKISVEQDVRLRGVKAALRHADRTGIDVVVMVGERERAEGAVLLRDMRSRDERRVPRDGVCQAVQQALG